MHDVSRPFYVWTDFGNRRDGVADRFRVEERMPRGYRGASRWFKKHKAAEKLRDRMNADRLRYEQAMYEARCAREKETADENVADTADVTGMVFDRGACPGLGEAAELRRLDDRAPQA